MKMRAIEKRIKKKLKEEVGVSKWSAEDVAAFVTGWLRGIRHILEGGEVVIFSAEDWLLPPETAEKIVEVLREAGWAAKSEDGAVIVYPLESEAVGGSTKVERRAEDVL